MLRIIATWGGDMTSARREAEKAFKKTEVNMESDISLEDMAKEINELEAQLADMKRLIVRKRWQVLNLLWKHVSLPMKLYEKS